MKALVLEEYNKLVFRDIEIPRPQKNEVLIKIDSCAVCGSDVHGIDGSTGRRIPPIVMGHEAAGTIHETGTEVSGFKKGDRVTFDSTIYCGVCNYCREGLINLCNNRRVLGVSCGEYRQNGAFAEYITVPSHILYKLPDNVSFDRAAMVEPLSIAYHAVRISQMPLYSSVAVFGAGTIGLLVIQLLKAAGCSMIIAVDIEENKLDMAKISGATHTVLSNKLNPAEKIREITGNNGADVAIEAVGIESTINSAVYSLKKGGTLVLVGNLSPKVNIPLQTIITGEITVKGSCASAGEYDSCLDLISRGVVDVDRLISAKVPLKDGPEWIGRLYRKEPGLMKVILKP